MTYVHSHCFILVDRYGPQQNMGTCRHPPYWLIRDRPITFGRFTLTQYPVDIQQLMCLVRHTTAPRPHGLGGCQRERANMSCSACESLNQQVNMMTNSSNEKLTFEWLRVSEYPAADYPRNFSPITVQCCETPVDGTVSLSLGKVNSVVRRDDHC